MIVNAYSQNSYTPSFKAVKYSRTLEQAVRAHYLCEIGHNEKSFLAKNKAIDKEVKKLTKELIENIKKSFKSVICAVEDFDDEDVCLKFGARHNKLKSQTYVFKVILTGRKVIPVVFDIEEFFPLKGSAVKEINQSLSKHFENYYFSWHWDKLKGHEKAANFLNSPEAQKAKSENIKNTTTKHKEEEYDIFAMDECKEVPARADDNTSNVISGNKKKIPPYRSKESIEFFDMGCNQEKSDKFLTKLKFKNPLKKYYSWHLRKIESLFIPFKEEKFFIKRKLIKIWNVIKDSPEKRYDFCDIDKLCGEPKADKPGMRRKLKKILNIVNDSTERKELNEFFDMK